MIRLDDPDAAEQAAEVFSRHYPSPLGGVLLHGVPARAIQAVLDAIEVPRLPTRSEVERAALRSTYDKSAVGMAKIAVENGWAVEDPEPEVDPAQVDALAQMLREGSDFLAQFSWTELSDDARERWAKKARSILASGRVSVKVERRP